jgi:hypothetical protein
MISCYLALPTFLICTNGAGYEIASAQSKLFSSGKGYGGGHQQSAKKKG